MSHLLTFGSQVRAAVFGAGGAIGGAFVDHLAAASSVAEVYALTRQPDAVPQSDKVRPIGVDLSSEDSLSAAAQDIKQEGALQLVIIATGILHDGPDLQPEKTWRHLDAGNMARVLAINTIAPSLVLKHFLPLLDRQRRSGAAALSARVGSISDNRLGGWHAYRASKAALNMVIKTASIELAHRSPQAFCVGLHPGTVDSKLSAPFQRGVKPEKLFSAAQSAGYLLDVLDKTTPAQSGRVFAWDGQEVPA